MSIKSQINTATALVLGNTAYQDDSAMITLAGEKGVFSLLCHGIYKPKSQLKPLLIAGSLVRVEFKTNAKGPNIASSVLMLEDASSLFLDFSKASFLVYLQEICLSLFKYGDPFPFEEARLLLHALKGKSDVLSIAILFLASFHRILGLEIQVHQCLLCGKSQNIVACSLKEGGFICQECFSQFHVDKTDSLTLYVMKFAFSPLSDDLMARHVPKKNGLYVLSDLHENLLDYFDLGQIKSYALFLQSLE